MISGLIPAIVAAIMVIIAGINTTTGDMNIAWGVVRAIFIVQTLSAAATGLTKSLDKFLHETGKELNNENLTKGITRF